VLSAFNGIESMIEKLYSDFDSDITIRSNYGKTFPQNRINLESIKSVPGVVNVSRAIEEVVVLKHEKKWVNATLLAVDSNFLRMARLTDTSSNGKYIHIVDGFPQLKSNHLSFGIIGATLLDKLGGYIPEKSGFEQLIVYAPKRDLTLRFGSNPFTMMRLDISSRMNYNREVNAEKMVVPLDFGASLLQYETDLSAILVDVSPSYSNEDVKFALAHKLGEAFTVKTSYEKNELIFKTSKSEKRMVIVILVFIFILAAFNLIASLTMLFIEKKDDLTTMIAFGASKKMIFRIFFLEGLMICGKGVFWGLLLGYTVCLIQIQGGLLEMPNSGGEAFPMVVSFSDACLILFLVSLLSFIFSYWPVKLLLKRNFRGTRF
jgi:lipoprotein-releasing system permease protein